MMHGQIMISQESRNLLQFYFLRDKSHVRHAGLFLRPRGKDRVSPSDHRNYCSLFYYVLNNGYFHILADAFLKS
jgi:hypothetical protein